MKKWQQKSITFILCMAMIMMMTGVVMAESTGDDNTSSPAQQSQSAKQPESTAPKILPKAGVVILDNLTIGSDGKVFVPSGTSLIINDNCKILIESGGILAISPGGIMNLSDGVLFTNEGSFINNGTVAISDSVIMKGNGTFQNMKLIHADANGGQIEGGDSIKYAEPPDAVEFDLNKIDPLPIRDLYDFTGWSDSPGGGTLYSDTVSLESSETTIYAQWEYNGPKNVDDKAGGSKDNSGNNADESQNDKNNASDKPDPTDVKGDRSPNTGDEGNIGLFIILCILSVLAGIYAFIRKEKAEYRNNR